ncbi:MAG: hypothetical protein Q7S20_10835 [Gemmatimonadaceae bacterium]|nr:hypothetical protein [Gemmatimonadaceae bacterium]
MTETVDTREPVPRRLPPLVSAVARGAEPLWVASTAALFVLWGYEWIPRLIRLMGRGGQTETVEWAVYMSLLAGFPLVAILVAVVLPRMFRAQAATVVKAATVIFAIWYAVLFAIDGRLGLAALALVPALVTTFTGAPSLMGDRSPATLAQIAILIVVSLIAWMCAAGLVYWTRASLWFPGSPVRLIAFAVATGISLWGLPRLDLPDEPRAANGVALRVLSALLLVALVVFSFRTNPVVEFYHWGFWTGPIEQLRQGGWLLRDTPSQYGFLSILIPAAMPGSAWQSFWFYQAAVYAVVAAGMFIVLRKMRGGAGDVLLAAGAVFTTLFFRPRTATLILPAQMTPSGGPVRFLWCFVMLAWLLYSFNRRRKNGDGSLKWLAFPFTGHLIWLCALAWSFEAAIYGSAIWFSAFAVYVIQSAYAWRREGASASSVAQRVIGAVAVPVGMAIALYGIVWAIYMAAVGAPPDLAGYVEYGLLYSRGFGALPIDTTGAVWYLLLVFFIVSTVVVHFLVEDWRDFRVVVAAGVWGGVWSLSSYFVSRSHPVNLFSITPALLFALAVLAIVLRAATRRPWHRYVRAAMVPVFAVPIAMTLGHPGLLADIGTAQLTPARFTDQLPLMDPELETLLRESGATPNDPIVRIADGRLVLPAWRGAGKNERVMSVRSWLPKPYEMIGTLSPEQRQVYIDRAAEKPIGGWMVQHQTDTVRWFGDHLKQIIRTHEPTRKYTRGPWSLWWMAPRAQVTR